MRVVELVQPVTDAQIGDVALVMRDNLPAMVDLKGAVEDFSADALSNLGVRVTALEGLMVTPLEYGAVGDGVADDTVAIQNMFDSDHVALNFLDKTYRVTNTIYQRTRKSIIGQDARVVLDREGTFIVPLLSVEPGADFSVYYGVEWDQNAVGIAEPALFHGLAYWWLSAVVIGANYTRWTNCTVRNSWDNGFAVGRVTMTGTGEVGNPFQATTFTGSPEGTYFDQCFGYTCGSGVHDAFDDGKKGAAFNNGSGSRTTFNNCFADRCYNGFAADFGAGAHTLFVGCTANVVYRDPANIFNGSGIGFWLGAGPNRLIGCRTLFAQQASFAVTEYASDTTLTDCESYVCQRNGFEIAGSNTMLANCTSKADGQAAVGAFVGYFVKTASVPDTYGPPNKVSFINCQAIGANISNGIKFEVGEAATNCQIVGGHFEGTVSGVDRGISDVILFTSSELQHPLLAQVTQPHYSSRAAFVAATVASYVQGWTVAEGGQILRYRRDASGTAITSANGVKGSPAGDAYAEHYSSNVGTGSDDTAAFTAALSYSTKVVGIPGKTYILGDLNVTGSRRTLDLRGCTVKRLAGANRALDVTGAFTEVIISQVDTTEVINPTTRKVNPSLALATTITGITGANTLTVSDATMAKVGMWVFFENAPRLATATVSPQPQEAANYITNVSGNTLTLGHAIDGTFLAGSKIIGDFGMIRVTGFASRVRADIRNCVVGFEIGSLSSSAGTTGAKIEGLVERVAGAGIVHTINSAAEITDKVVITGGLNVDLTSIATAAQTVFPYDWNISRRIHRGGSERSISVTVNGVSASIASVDQVAGTITLSTPCTGGESVRTRNNEYVARGLYYAGVGGSVNGAGLLSNAVVLAASVGWEIRGVTGGTGGVQYSNAVNCTLDTCSYIGIWLRGSSGFDFSGVKSLFATYPVVVSESASGHSFVALATTIPPNTDVEDVANYPFRSPIIVDSGCTLIHISRDTWRSNTGNFAVVDPGNGVVYLGDTPVTPSMFGFVDSTSGTAEALQIAINSGYTNIRIPAGSWAMTSKVNIPSTVNGLKIELDPAATLVRSFGGTLFAVSELSKGYAGARDITIQGGAIDGNFLAFYTASNLIYMEGVDGFEVRGVKFINTPGLHALDLNQCRGGRVSNCKFLGTSLALALSFGGSGYYPEAIQISHRRFADGGTVGCSDIEVMGCEFGPGDSDAWWVGVGEHGGTHNVYHKNIRVHDNEFYGCGRAGTTARRFDGYSVERNRFVGGARGVLLQSVLAGSVSAQDETDAPSGVCQANNNVTVAHNDFRDQTVANVDVAGSAFTTATGWAVDTDVRITGNHIRNTSFNSAQGAIRLNWVKNAIVSNNQIFGGSRGVYGRFCTSVAIYGNLIDITESQGILITEETETDFVGLGLTGMGHIFENTIRNVPYSGCLVSGAIGGFNVGRNVFQDVSTISDNEREPVRFAGGAFNGRADGNTCLPGTAINKNKVIAHATSTCADIHMADNTGYAKTCLIDNRATGACTVTTSGTGSPEGVVYAPLGSVYTRTDGAPDTARYVKHSASSANTGWRAVTAEQLVAADAVAIPHTGTTALTVVKTLTIPGGLMGPNGELIVSLGVSVSNNANAKTLGVKINGVSVCSQAAALASTAHWATLIRIQNRNSVSSQVMRGAGAQNPFGTTGAAATTTALATGSDMTLTIEFTLANAADTMTLEQLDVRTIYKS